MPQKTTPADVDAADSPGGESSRGECANSPTAMDQRPLLNESGQLNSRPDLRFPHPSERPDTIVVIFDGKCRFCTRQVRTLQRLDLARRLSFISLHDPHVAEWYPDLTYDQLMDQIFVIPPTADGPTGNVRYGGAEGFRYIAWRLPLLWPLAVLLSIPFSMPLWKGIYDFIARQRYRFGKLGDPHACGPDGTCELHFGSTEKGSTEKGSKEKGSVTKETDRASS